MDRKMLKNVVAKFIAKMAINKSYKTVGRSFPIGAHEVQVPDQLKHRCEEGREMFEQEDC